TRALGSGGGAEGLHQESGPHATATIAAAPRSGGARDARCQRGSTQMRLHFRPLILTTLAGSACVLTTELAEAAPVSAPQTAVESGAVSPDAAPQLPAPAVQAPDPGVETHAG